MMYKCSGCKRKGVKLWREYNTFLDHITLECSQCVLKSQDKKGYVRADGKYVPIEEDHYPGLSDSIGWRVPACPTELPNARWNLPKDATFWGYCSVPQDKVEWWRSLPL